MSWAWRRSPNFTPGIIRLETSGTVIHSTRGGAAYGIEYDATLNWFARPDSQVSAHAVLGRDGRQAQCVDWDRMAWHAEELNRRYLGVELEQPTICDEYTEVQYHNLAQWLVQMSKHFGFPLDHGHVLGHEFTAPGERHGKSDPGPRFNWDRLFDLTRAIVL